jgi:hypothetical protein
MMERKEEEGKKECGKLKVCNSKTRNPASSKFLKKFPIFFKGDGFTRNFGN